MFCLVDKIGCLLIRKRVDFISVNAYNITMSLLYGVGEFFAVDIGTASIRLLQLAGDQQRGWTLQRYAYVPVDARIVQDSSPLGRKKLSEAIRTAVVQSGVKTKNVAVGLEAQKTYTAIIEVDNLPEKELDKIVKYELDQYIPMPIDDAQVDYVLLGASPNDTARAEVLVSSTSTAYAEEKMELFESLGLNVIAQEPEQLAAARALAPVGVTDARMIIDLGERSTDLVVLYQGMPRLVRSIPGGLALLSRTVSGALSVKEEHARQFVLRFGLAQDKLEGQVFRVLDPALENFAQELSKSIKFFNSKYPNVGMGGVVLSGFAGVIPFMAEYIEVKIGISTVQGNPWQLVKVRPEQSQALSPVSNEFAAVIGLAQRSNV